MRMPRNSVAGRFGVDAGQLLTSHRDRKQIGSRAAARDENRDTGQSCPRGDALF